MSEDEKLLRQAEKALTEIKVAQGLSDEQASVLAALRLRLTGDAGKSLDDIIAAAGDLGGPSLDDIDCGGPEEEGGPRALTTSSSGTEEEAVARRPALGRP